MKAKGIIPGIGLDENKGFTLPSNIGELGDDITELDLSYCSLTGRLSTRSERVIFVLIIAIFAVGCLPTALGDLVNLTVFNVLYNNIQGQLSIRAERLMFATENMRCCAGPPLPETLQLLARLANLEVLSLGGHKLGRAIPADVAVFTDLKELGLSNMGLGGKLLSTRSERFSGSL